MSPLPRHLRSFSLRTLMVLVGLVCLVTAWLAHERKTVQARRALIGYWNSDQRYSSVRFADDRLSRAWRGTPNKTPRVPWIRRLLGDDPVEAIRFRGSERAIAIERAREWFPEAEVTDGGEWVAGPYFPLPPATPAAP